MKNKFQPLVACSFLILIAVAGCQEESEKSSSPKTPPAVTYFGSFEHVDQTGGEGIFTYSQDLGTTPVDVYFVFTNSQSSSTDPAVVSSIGEESALESNRADSLLPKMLLELQSVDLLDYARTMGIGLKDLPAAMEFNANPPSFGETVDRRTTISGVPEPLYADAIGDTTTFMNKNTSDLIPATLQHQIVVDSRTLNLWVADDAWEGCSKKYCVNQSMVEAYGEKFLKSGSDNDAWDWVSNICGAHWGTHSYGNMLAPSATSQIDILFFDVDGDDSSDGGVLGFFWSKDNYLVSAVSYSNQRLMIYIDSVLAATPTGTTWQITDYWPAKSVSTLSHEFQHMIHFYQKTMSRAGGTITETWLNELSSMVVEDLIADKLGIDGPRGVAHTTGSAGTAGNIDGRLPRFNNYNYLSLTTWYSGSSSLASYSMSYSFGAYLVRNFGGAELIQKLIQSSYTGTSAVDNALTDLGYSETFVDVLNKWGIAVLMSNLTDNESGYRYNTGTYFTDDLNGVVYNIGSINLFNYNYNGVAGPRAFSTDEVVSNLGTHYANSNTFVLVGTDLTGDFEKQVDMPVGVTLSVVTKGKK